MKWDIDTGIVDNDNYLDFLNTQISVANNDTICKKAQVCSESISIIHGDLND